MIFCRSVPNGDVSILVLVLSIFLLTSTQENTMIYNSNGHFAIVGAVVAPRQHGFQ
jgi:hypothetical protein